jgi:D-lactate dehydrogenase (cytochrome)
MQTQHVIDDLVSDLASRLGDRVTTSRSIRERHGQDESYHAPFPPDAVVFPHSTAEVAEIVRLCAARRTPVIPYGVGTSLEGNITAVRGGVCIDLGQMNRVLEVNREDLDCRVQPGVTRKQLNRELNGTGLFFPIDPGADATLGGMASTRGSGTMAVRYGTMRENVLALEVVLADGRVIRTSRRARKSAAGYDLTRLFVGAEGTLGVITEVTVRLHPLPEAISSAVCAFPSLKAAIDTVILTIQLGIPVARIEILDEVMMDAARSRSSPSASAKLRASTEPASSAGRSDPRSAAAYGTRATIRCTPRWVCARGRVRSSRTCASPSRVSPNASLRRVKTSIGPSSRSASSATSATATSIC